MRTGAIDLHAALAAAGDAQSACAAAVDVLARDPAFKPSAYLERGGRLRCQALRTYRQAFDGIPHGAGMIGRAYSSGRVCFSADVSGDPDYLEITEGVVAEICAPLHADGAVVGVVSVESLQALVADDRAWVVECAAALSARLQELGGGLRETPAQRLVRHATRLTDTKSRRRLEREILDGAADVAQMDSALILSRNADGKVRVLDAIGPLALEIGSVPEAALRKAADFVAAGTSCFTVGEPELGSFKGLGVIQNAGAGSLAVLSLSAVPHRVLLVADREPNPISTETIELLELLCAHGASALRVADLVNDLRHQAATDPLTGLGHHRAFHRRLEAEPTLTPVALLVLDLDGFKAVNDGRGHAAGDRLLREIAAVLRETTRDSDDVFRVGGDEFAVFAPAGDAGETQALAERIVGTVREQTSITVSVGVALARVGESLTQTLLRADRALYAAKAAGRDQAHLARP